MRPDLCHREERSGVAPSLRPDLCHREERSDVATSLPQNYIPAYEIATLRSQ